MSDLLQRLIAALGHRFNSPELLQEALTHRSFSGRHNERLEFLGDAVLSFVIAAELYARYPGVDEGSLSRLRAALVKGETLAEIARRLGLGDLLQLGTGELKSGGFRRASILADALEAIIGAVYLDSGIDAARATILTLYGADLERVAPIDSLKDPKTRLQEYLQGRRMPLPRYEIVSQSGDAHDQVFEVACVVDALNLHARGTGTSRRKAEQSAATEILRTLNP